MSQEPALPRSNSIRPSVSFGTGLSDGSCKPFMTSMIPRPFRNPCFGNRRSAKEAPFFEHDVYDDCDIPLDVVSGLLAAGSSTVTTGFAVSENGGLARSGDAEKSDAEEEIVPSLAPLGRGQRKTIGTSRYRGPLWEEHW
ncbi:hypothetical protein K438DRAFT_1783058 [Mycena galopus ATCC 62051]|nr:hypothetical protein K438DRAFT_1783058 [Mycena galopus ATCC 62051]